MMQSPNVENIRDERNNLLEESVAVSTLIRAALYVKSECGISHEKLEGIIYHTVGANVGYSSIVTEW